MLKQILKTYGRRRPDDLSSALMALPHPDLVFGIVELFSTGELRLTTKAAIRKAQKMCSKFYAYHEKNPRVATWFLQAAQALQQERRHYAISALTERIRHDIRIGIIKTDTDGFRISNDVRACYVRLVVMRDPSLCGLFTLRPSKVDDTLVVDGRSWSEFAKAHHAQLWPDRETKSQHKAVTAVVQSSEKELA
jgi:hypothetical protein